MTKKIASTALLGTSLLFAVGASAAEQDLSGLLGVDAAAMSDTELAAVEGKAHGGFPLGALLLERANPKLLETPAWTERGLNPGFGTAMVNAKPKGGN